ncbi:hypothetical protein [Pseudomonas fontis]|uniref:Uncharacterized protein n=1 Tax=Pseudomonas fontis TaxID=2942633 RepID=A0ABT5NL33_9PSED|nr:hypothetical protein [Pseudomonas fontis]MDD0975402.1 hypothetical protein [Pseudomonas fontis]MDD0989235.1 hypothetical protein [Pseudomonas fontis]
MSRTASVWVDSMSQETTISIMERGKGRMDIIFQMWSARHPESLCKIAESTYGELYDWINPKPGSVVYMSGDQAEQTLNYLKEAN